MHRTTAAARLVLPPLAAGVLTLAFAVLAHGPAADARSIVAVYPPWWPPGAVLAAASSAGEPAGIGGAAFAVALRSTDPGLIARARRSGALFALEANASILCLFR